MKRRLSIYGRTLVSISLAILIIFVVLALVYAAIFTTSSKQLRLEDLDRNAKEIADFTSRHIATSGRVFVTREVSGYWSFAARSSGAIVCIVDSNRHIIYDTGLPEKFVSELDYDSEQQYYVLPYGLINQERTAYSEAAKNTALEDLFVDADDWLVASSPLPSYTRIYSGEVLLFRHLKPDSFFSFLQDNSVTISFLIAFLLSLIIIVILSRSITKPISELAKTADKVYKGDLSARVRLGKKEKTFTLDNVDEDNPSHEDDLTLLVRTFNTLIAKFEEQEIQQREFLSSVSHDLRTPVTSIHGFVEAMRDGTVSHERFPYYLNIVKAETERLQKLIDSLFEQAVEGHTDSLKPTLFNINDLIIQVVKSLEPQIRDKNLTLELQLAKKKHLSEEKLLDTQSLKVKESDIAYIVKADKDAITRVLNNIITNAIRYTPRSGIILIRTKIESDLLHVYIEDNGEGIKEEDLPHIFDRFYKAERSRSTEGSGLGLYIARTLIKRHGQMIKAYRSELGGAGFVFTLERPN